MDHAGYRRGRARSAWAAIASACLVAAAATGQTEGTAITDMTVRRAQVETFATVPEAAIEALRFSPASDVLACGTSSGRIVLFDVPRGTVWRTLRAEGGAVTSLSFSPDGRFLATADASGAVDVWNPDTGERIWSAVDTAAVHEAGFSPQGTFLVAVGDGRAVRIWDVETWAQLPSIEGHTGPVYAFAISPEEDLLVTGAGDSDPTIRLWRFPSGEPLGSDLYEGRVHDIEYSPRDRQVAVSGTQPTVWLWEVDRLAFLHLIFGGRAPVADVAYSSRGTALVSACENGAFLYHRVPDVYEQRMTRFEEPLSAIDYSPDRRFIACGDRSGTILLLWVP